MPITKKAAPKVAPKVAPKTAAKKAVPTKATKKEAPKRKGDVSKFVARAKNFGIGQAVPYKRDISRFMRWPRFVTVQRKKRVLQRRLKTPPALNQFNKISHEGRKPFRFPERVRLDPYAEPERRIRGGQNQCKRRYNLPTHFVESPFIYGFLPGVRTKWRAPNGRC